MTRSVTACAVTVVCLAAAPARVEAQPGRPIPTAPSVTGGAIMTPSQQAMPAGALSMAPRPFTVTVSDGPPGTGGGVVRAP